MNIGDNVRGKRTPEKGFITKIISDKEVEVEIDGGFRVPFLKSELVVVAEAEKTYFANSTATPANSLPSTHTSLSQTLADRGFFLGLKYANDKELDIFIINNTDLTLFFCLGTEYKKNYQGIACGELKAKTFRKVHQASTVNIEEWSTIIVQALFFQQGIAPFREAKLRRINVKSLIFQKNKHTIPLLNAEGYVIQLDEEIQEIQAALIQNHLLENTPPTNHVIVPRRVRNQAIEIDLHIEALQGKTLIEKGKELEAQIKFFEKVLDEAIAQGTDSLTVIHGVGNGILKNEIAKIVSKNPYVAYFKDAKREKFGYGATFIKMK